MSKVKYASIVPLIGGQTMGMEKVWGEKPEFFLSFPGFQDHDQHARAYYPNTPYHIVEDNTLLDAKFTGVDVLSTTCPCAGLSSLSPSANSESATNDWMLRSADVALGQVKPRVFWGENAPRLATKMGEPTVKKLKAVGAKYGYTFSLYQTKSKFHGLPQVRDRAFYFFWKGTESPLLNYYAESDGMPIEDVIRYANESDDPMSEFIPNKNTPSDDPLYRYVLEVMHGGISHVEFAKMIEKTTNPMDYIEDAGIDYRDVAVWLRDKGFEKKAVRCETMHAKLAAGGSIMRKTVTIPKGLIGAFVGHFPMMLTHPDEDRFISVRESLAIMSMPEDFQPQGSINKNLNHICQNVPVTTAADMSTEIDQFLSNRLPLITAKSVIQDNRNRTNKIVPGNCPTLEEFI